MSGLLNFKESQFNPKLCVREGCRKKTRKKSGLLPNRGGVSRRVVKSQTSTLEKYFFSGEHVGQGQSTRELTLPFLTEQDTVPLNSVEV